MSMDPTGLYPPTFLVAAHGYTPTLGDEVFVAARVVMPRAKVAQGVQGWPGIVVGLAPLKVANRSGTR